MNSIMQNEKGQALPRGIVPLGESAFAPCAHTQIRWLGGAGVLLNVRGTRMMIDPVLQGFDMPLLIQPPVAAADVPLLDGVLITHIDNDHCSEETLRALCHRQLYAPGYVAQALTAHGLPAHEVHIGERFRVGKCEITPTPAKHDWQNHMPEPERVWALSDYCGYMIETPDGRIWLPGDSQLLDEHLTMPAPDVILFDFSDHEWHITFEGAVRLANAYPEAALLCIHWGTVDAPDFAPFNGDPRRLLDRVVNPERVCALQPGEALILSE